MSWRKWLVRGLVFTVAGCLVAAGWVYQRWTNSAVVRQQVINHLQVLFPSAGIALDSARLRLLGGIALKDLRLARRDDPTHTDFVYVPSARLYHDKEQVLQGTLALRKVELFRPRLRVVREKDGSWNWADLLAPSDPRAPLPTLVVDDGTVLLEDHQSAAGLPALEITRVQLTVVNDPVGTLTVLGVGRSETLGQVKLHATWHRDSRHGTLNVEALAMPLTTALVHRLAAPYFDLAGAVLEGTADFRAAIRCRPGESEPMTWNGSCHIKAGKLQHPRLPLALDNVELAARCADGRLTVDHLTASAGATRVSGSGEARLPRVADNFAAQVFVNDLPVTRELCQRLPGNLERLYDAVRPRGSVNAEINYVRQEGAWQRKRCLVLPQQMAICYNLFEYPVQDVTGKLDVDQLQALVKIDLAGKGGQRPVFLRGSWQGLGPAARVALDIGADQVPLDERLISALPAKEPNLQDLARSFHATGRADVAATIRHNPFDPTYTNTYWARFADAAVKWDGFPYPVENLTGTLTIFPDRHWEFKDFVGSHNGAEVRVSGQSLPLAAKSSPGESHVVIDLSGRGVGIDGDLRRALEPMPGLAHAWDAFRPGGRLSFRARVDRLPDRPQDVEIAVEVGGCTLLPVFFKYTLHDLSGKFHFKDNELRVEKVRASHGTTALTLAQATVRVGPGGAYKAVLEDIAADPVVPDEEFLAALPPALAAGVQALTLTAPFRLKARKVQVTQPDVPISRPYIWWDGQLWLEHARLNLGVEASDVTGTAACVGAYDGGQIAGLAGNVAFERATILKQPFADLRAHLLIDGKAPHVLTIDQLGGPLYGGDLSGQAHLDFGAPLRFDLNLTASEIDLRQVGRQNLGPRSELAGRAWARLCLSCQGEGIRSLEGNGTFHVPRGKLYNLPFLDDVLRFLGLRSPDRATFDEAHADFSIHGRRLRLERLDLWGTMLSLCGAGTLNLDGSETAVDLYPSWGPLEQVLPQAIRNVSPTLSKGLLKIEVRGKVGGRPDELKLTKKPIPVIVDPILHLRDRMSRTERK